MEKRILAIDIGGSAVKAQLFDEKTGDPHEFTSWRHDYNRCTSEEAIRDLCQKLVGFTWGYEVTGAGIGIAGLMAKDNTLYRSTVLGSLVGVNLPEIIMDTYKIRRVTVDNDADCGGFGVFHHLSRRYKYETCPHGEKYIAESYDDVKILYLVLGSGLGSSYIEREAFSQEGKIVSKQRFDPKEEFKEANNNMLNDVGLMLPLPKEVIHKKLEDHSVYENVVEKTLKDEDPQLLLGPCSDTKSYRVGTFASAPGVVRFLEMICTDNDLGGIRGRYLDKRAVEPAEEMNRFFGIYTECADLLADRRSAAKRIADFARAGEKCALMAYYDIGWVLGYAAAKAVEDIRRNHMSYRYSALTIAIAGEIANSADLFMPSAIDNFSSMNQFKHSCSIYGVEFVNATRLFKHTTPNLFGAFCRWYIRGTERYCNMIPDLCKDL